jgi:hypothetical protein
VVVGEHSIKKQFQKSWNNVEEAGGENIGFSF